MSSRFYRFATGVQWIIFLLSCGVSAPIRAQVLDPAFSLLDARTTPRQKGVAVRDIVLDPAGRVLIGGAFDLLNGQRRGNVQRLLATGQPDPAFGASGSGANGQVSVIVPLSNGQYLIGGTFTHYDNQPAGHLARLHPDGTLDLTFNAAGVGTDAEVVALAVDGQGRIVVGGAFTDFNGHPVPGLVRLLPDGSYDAAFGAPFPGAEPTVSALAVDAADRVLVGGATHPFAAGAAVPYLERLLPSGSADGSFAPAPLDLRDWVVAIGVLPNGQLLVAGWLTTAPGPPATQGIRRLNANGTSDTTFAPPFTDTYVTDFAVLPNGQLLLVGSGFRWGSQQYAQVCRLQSNGTPDAAFVAARGRGSYEGAYAVAADPAGRVLIGGSIRTSQQPQNGLFRLTGTGSYDAGFAAPLFTNYAAITHLGRQANDRVVALGNFLDLNGQATPPLVRFGANGALDPAFQLDSALIRSVVLRSFVAMAVAANDQLIVAGLGHVFRLLPDGTHDPSFNDGDGTPDPEVRDLRLQGDGRVLVWGDFSSYDRQNRRSLVRLTTRGRVDSSFASVFDTAAHYLTDVAPLADGSIGVLCDDGLYWLNAAGGPLVSFNGGRLLRGITSLLALPDSGMLVTGRFVLNGLPYAGTYKLTRTGLDTAFALAPGLMGSAVDARPDGLILFRELSSAGSRLRRLFASGALDPAFAPVEVGTGTTTETARAYLYQSTGDLVIGGGFVNIGGTSRPTLARLTNIPNGLPEAGAGRRVAFDAYPSPTHDHFTLRRPTAESATATLLDVLGRPVRQWPLTAAETRLSVAGVPAGTYVVRVVGTSGVLTRRVVVE